jgi:hypothetical protein
MADNHSAADAVTYGGIIREDVMDKIWDISNIPLPFTEMCSKGTHSNRRVEFVTDELASAGTGNAAVEGADVSSDNTKFGLRIGNYTQISVKGLKVTDTVEAADSIGGMAKLSYQISQRQKELRQDVEAQMLSNQASVAGDASTVAGISAGLGAQIKTNISLGATGVAGGFNTTTGLFVATTPGTKRALSETTLRDVLQSVYEAGGNTSVLMARPPVIRAMSEYLFTSTARVATMSADQAQNSPRALTAYGSVNVFVTDFGQTIQMRDNRIQPVTDTATSTVYLLDSTHLKQSFLRGYQTETLAKTGLSEKRQISVQYSLLLLNEKSCGAIYAIDEALAMVA